MRYRTEISVLVRRRPAAREFPEIRCETVGSLRTVRFAVANLVAVLLRNIWRLVFAREYGPQVIAGNVQLRQLID